MPTFAPLFMPEMVRSGSEPGPNLSCQIARSATFTQSAGRPVDVVFGRITPNTSEGGGLVAGAQHPEEAKLFLDWMAGEEAAKILGGLVGATAVPGHGLVNLDEVTIWAMRRPVDIEAFRKEWASKFVTN